MQEKIFIVLNFVRDHSACVCMRFLVEPRPLQHFSQSLQFEKSVKYAHVQKITRVAVFEYSGYLYYARALCGWSFDPKIARTVKNAVL